MQARAELREGWYDLEPGNWRWTAQQFAVSVDAHGNSGPAVLQFHFTIHEGSLANHEPLTLRASANGHPLPPQQFNTPGPQLYAQSIPADAMSGTVVRVEFALSHALPGTADDQRSLGVQVSFEDPAGPIRLVV